MVHDSHIQKHLHEGQALGHSTLQTTNIRASRHRNGGGVQPSRSLRDAAFCNYISAQPLALRARLNCSEQRKASALTPFISFSEAFLRAFMMSAYFAGFSRFNVRSTTCEQTGATLSQMDTGNRQRRGHMSAHRCAELLCESGNE